MSNPPNLPSYLKAAILIVAATFLAYGIYWEINGVIWANSLTQIFSAFSSGQIDFSGPITATHAVISISIDIWMRIVLTAIFDKSVSLLIKEGDINPLNMMPKRLDTKAYRNNIPKILALILSDSILKSLNRSVRQI